ncbi:MAG: hypothetical protein LQ351_003172 [Letrouitia transgressa]|nr:MAG: hypothetical protein LQ351_003172 [Letrouitia transgressa]
MDRYGRPLSPGGRRVGQPGRSSTGTLIYPSPFDPYYGPTRSSRELTTAAGPRSSAERVVPSSRVVPKYKPASPPSRQSGDDFVVRPRRLTLDPAAAEMRRPLSVIGPSSPNRSRPVITTADRPASPLSKPARSRPEESYYLQPASSTRREHRRNYSIGPTDSSRANTDNREMHERGGYRTSGIRGGRDGYNLNQPLVRQPQGDRDRGGYEYTDRREQMYRDTEPRPRPRRETYSGRERPLSMVELDYATRPERHNREAGPPVTMRGFDALGRSASVKQGPGSGSDYDPAPSEFSRDDYERRKAHVPRIALHQGHDDERTERLETKSREPYDEAYDHGRRHNKALVGDGRAEGRLKDYRKEDSDRNGEDRSRRHHDRDHHKGHDHRENEDWDRERDRDRGRRDDPPREKHYHGDFGAKEGLLLGGAAAASAMGAEAAKHHHSHRDRDEADSRQDPTRVSRDKLTVGRDPAESTSNSTVSAEVSDEERRERHRRRRERREHEDREAQGLADRDRRRVSDEGAYQRSPDRRQEFAQPRENIIRKQGSYERKAHDGRVGVSHDGSRLAPEEPRHRSHHHRHHSRSRDQDSYSEGSSTDGSSDVRPRNIPLVTPAEEKPEPQAPRGILRKPKEKFPEDPAPVREGVAPLKDAGKKGIPPNARWTKIDRKLVNPEALVAGNERYEERPDYVIVLRVLTKEEIEQYAAKTQEIRAQRGALTMGEGSGSDERR